MVGAAFNAAGTCVAGCAAAHAAKRTGVGAAGAAGALNGGHSAGLAAAGDPAAAFGFLLFFFFGEGAICGASG